MAVHSLPRSCSGHNTAVFLMRNSHKHRSLSHSAHLTSTDQRNRARDVTTGSLAPLDLFENWLEQTTLCVQNENFFLKTTNNKQIGF